MSELAGQFQRLEELCSRLEGPGVRICDQLLGPSPGQAHWADRLEEAAGQLEAMMTEWCHADAELEALQASTALVWDLVLGGAGGSSSLRRPWPWWQRRLRNG
jgi:hypothetical protein